MPNPNITIRNFCIADAPDQLRAWDARPPICPDGGGWVSRGARSRVSARHRVGDVHVVGGRRVPPAGPAPGPRLSVPTDAHAPGRRETESTLGRDRAACRVEQQRGSPRAGTVRLRHVPRSAPHSFTALSLSLPLSHSAPSELPRPLSTQGTALKKLRIVILGFGT